MHESAVQELDRAALSLLQALERYGADLNPYLESAQLQALHTDVTALRRALLGAQMGPLYWDTPAALVDGVLGDESLPVQAAAERVAQLLNQKK
ncbi:MAG: hypothetical protein JNK29_17595 [Anaerolineales bacterium]|nr:hypothetical protein [Anaerolineales bacterium]